MTEKKNGAGRGLIPQPDDGRAVPEPKHDGNKKGKTAESEKKKKQKTK